MNLVCRAAVVAAITALVASPVSAMQAPPQAGTTQPQDQQKPAPKPEPKPEDVKYEETVVVSASKAEEKLINAPATMTVIGARAIQSATSQNFAELLRAVPGVNITQVSARDINITTRGATGTLATGNLALLDGRSIYQDFFGFVMWDFLPVNLNEIKQVEVIRGPASAVWGANALYGVVNVITKSPREIQGTSGVFGIGGFDGGDGSDAGTVWYGSVTHAQAINDRWAYKISGGGFSQDALPRPAAGTPIPCERPEVCSGPRQVYPPFANQGSSQPKLDGRVDYDYPDGAKLMLSGGVAGTDGIMHTGIGPFNITRGSVMGYAKANYSNKGFRAGFFTNILNGDADNLLTTDASRNALTLNFDTSTYDFEASNVQAYKTRHVFSYGGNLRFNRFQLSLAPEAEDRTEFGVYGQDEIFLSKHFRAIVGGRVDRFDYLEDFVFSPRTTFMVKPREDQTFRVSYNRAYRSPSVINNFLQTVIGSPVSLAALGGPSTYLLPLNIVGNPDLEEQVLDTFEIGYSGVVKRAVISSAFYVNKLKNDILFTEDRTGRYTAASPPPNWPLPPVFINFIPGASLPGRFTYLNFGHSTQKGFEIGVDTPVNAYLTMFTNYSYQSKPDPEDFPITELNLPAQNRFNLGVNFDRGRCFGNMSVSYSDSAFWQDVLDDPYHGTTDSYTLVNAGFGVRWANNKLTTSVKATNLGNQDIQQHVFGDITRRQIVGEFRVQF